jgi:Uma2 family endonuclease
MTITLVFEEQIEIPMDLRSLADFRRWATSDHFPERGRIDYIAGRIDVDMSPEDLHTHGIVKTELIGVLWHRIKEQGLGQLYTDSTRVSCPEADLSAEPDVVFVSESSLDSGRVRLVPKTGGGPDRYVELEGPPDLIVEIVSDASVRKDTERLPAAYYRAGVTEFWLIDARGQDLLFRIHHRGQSQYEPAATDADGCQYSAVLDRRYRLDRSRNAKGRIVFDLLEQEPA